MSQHPIFNDVDLDTFKAVLLATGWQTSGNNIHRMPGVELCAAAPGHLEPVYGQTLRLIGRDLVVFEVQYDHKPDGTLAYRHVEIARFVNLADALCWLSVHGRRSAGGQSHIPGRFLS